MLKRIWNDPVGSNVLASIIIAILGALGVWIYGIFAKTSFYTAWLTLYNIKISIVWITVLIISSIIGVQIYKRIRQNTSEGGNQITSKAEEELRKINQLTDGNILWKWDVMIGGLYYEKPEIANLTPYCLCHGNTPYRMRIVTSFYECPVPNCQNIFHTSNMYSPNYHQIKVMIESQIEQKYEQLMN